MKAIFDTKSDSKYDDNVEGHYHFPKQYLSVAKQTIGDWIVYREPVRGNGRKGYVAIAQVERIDCDPCNIGSYHYAFLNHYTPFDTDVPFAGGSYESRLRGVHSNRRGVTLRGNSIRSITDRDFEKIVRAGFRETLDPQRACRLELTPEDYCPETATMSNWHVGRICAAAFRRSVLDAYDDRCAVTGMRIANGGGKVEARAAHIQPAHLRGPGIVQNGIALSTTAYWLFDRNLISLREDYSLQVAHAAMPAEMDELLQGQVNRILLPDQEEKWPKVQYINQRHYTYAMQ